MRRLAGLALAAVWFCAPPLFAAPARNDAGALKRVQTPPAFLDDGEPASLRASAEQSLLYYRGLPQGTSFRFGPDTYRLEDLVRTMEDLTAFLAKPVTPAELDRHLKKHYAIYRAAGTPAKGEVVFSSYHEATLEASLKRGGDYRYPVYARPPDLVDVRLERFDPKREGERFVGRAEGPELVPYPSREDIDTKGVLKGKGLEIAWAKNPVDILFLQIQGSGALIEPNGETWHIRYAGDNGLPFRSVGLSLIESGEIPKAEFSKKRMVEYLNGLDEEARQAVLNRNPRYIFFEITSGTTPARGSLMVALTPERSIASDPKIYPRGALAFIRTRRPAFAADGSNAGEKPLARFVLNQDEGGAIQGRGRIDFFAGRGVLAERMASRLWYPGELYFFVKRPSK